MNDELRLPDRFIDPSRYEKWLLEARESGHSSSQILLALEAEGSPEAWLRCARIALGMDDYALARHYALVARLSPRREVEVYANALLATILAQEARARQGPSERNGASQTIPALLQTLEEIRELPNKTALSLEAECVVRLAIGFSFQQLGKFDRALAQASEVLVIAKSLGLPLTERGAHTQMTLCLIALGRLDESLPLLREQVREPLAHHFSTSENRRQLAEVFFTLGDVEDAVHLLSESDPSATSESWVRATIQLYRLLSGSGGMEQGVDRDHLWAGLYGDLAEALQALIITLSLLPQAQHRPARDEALTRVLELTDPRDRVQDRWLNATIQWVRSLAYSKLGRLGLAGEMLRKAPEVYPQWLDIRLMLAGQQLELALQPTDAGVQSVRLSEQALRAVFEEAHGLPYASRAGLAQRLRFWHPQAAAYAAVMPQPIEELLTAQESILRVGERNSVYGLTVPPVYAVELTLRSLGLDQRRTFAPARLNKTQTAQRQALFAAGAAIPVWRPVVGAALLILALYQVGLADYEGAARRVARSFGLVPQNKTPYMEAELEQIEQLLAGLLEGRVSHAQAVKKLNEI